MAAGHGGGKKSLVPANGCARFLLFYVVGLLAVVGSAFVLGSGLLNNLPGIGTLTAGLSTNRGTTTQAGTNGNGIVAVAPPGTGGGGLSTTGGTGGGTSQIASQQVASPQGGTLTAWTNQPFYIVQPGDTLDSIAAAFGLRTADILSNNIGLTEAIYANQVIYLPVAGVPLPGTGRNSTQP